MARVGLCISFQHAECRIEYVRCDNWSEITRDNSEDVMAAELDSRWLSASCYVKGKNGVSVSEIVVSDDAAFKVESFVPGRCLGAEGGKLDFGKHWCCLAFFLFPPAFSSLVSTSLVCVSGVAPPADVGFDPATVLPGEKRTVVVTVISDDPVGDFVFRVSGERFVGKKGG